ncbi:MAG: insulinase family protein [Patescibacteria group bacterium]|nr:insulinase family protein [Patescibacteria group bacterium]
MINHIKNGWKNNCGFILTFSNGSFFESSKTNGFTHIAEHLMFSGTKNIPKIELDKIFVNTLHDLEAVTSREALSVFCYFNLNDFEIAVKTIYDFIYNWECTADQFKDEKSQLVDESQEYFSSFDYKKRKYVYPSLPIHQSEPLGSLKLLKSLKFDDVKAIKSYWNVFVKKSNIDIIVMTGNISNNQKKLVNKLFAKIQNKTVYDKAKKSVSGKIELKRSGGFYFSGNGYNPKSLLLNEIYKNRWMFEDKFDFDYDFVQIDNVTAFFVFHIKENIDGDLLKEFFYKIITKSEFDTAKKSFLKKFNERIDSVNIVDSLRWFAGFQSRNYLEIEGIKDNPEKLYRYFEKIDYKEMLNFAKSIQKCN